MPKAILFLYLLCHTSIYAFDDLEINIETMGSDKYSLSILSLSDLKQSYLKEQFVIEVNKVCGTRFEIVNTNFAQINENGQEKRESKGMFKCFVNSQM